MKSSFDSLVDIEIADPRLAGAVRRAIQSAVRRAVKSLSLDEPSLRVVRLRTHKRFVALGVERLRGAIVVVRVTLGNARRLPDLVDAIRGADAAGVQLVWDGRDPERSGVERFVFGVLERARATPAGPPVVLAKSDEPVVSLRILVADRTRKAEPRP